MAARPRARRRAPPLSSRSTGRRPRARARWRAVSPSVSALPISTPARSTGRRRCSCWTQAGDPADPATRKRRRGASIRGCSPTRGCAATRSPRRPRWSPRSRQVRHALLGLQRDFAAHPPAPARGAVLDGRDIGTVVCPAADVKLFVTASPEARARRRVKELREQGAAAIYENVLQDLKRTRRARQRAPGRPAGGGLRR